MNIIYIFGTHLVVFEVYVLGEESQDLSTFAHAEYVEDEEECPQERGQPKARRQHWSVL